LIELLRASVDAWGNVDFPDDAEYMLLVLSSTVGNANVIRVLLEAGADPDKFGSPLFAVRVS
jgi:hypothetical protein